MQTQSNIDGNNNGKTKSENELLIDNGQHKELYKQLKKYREQILFTDSMRLGEIKNQIVIISKEQDSVSNENFLKECLTADPPLGTLAYLNLLQNNLVVAEARCIQYYNEQVMTHIPWFKSYEAILGQNAKILKVGDSLEITGGVGSFSKQRLLQLSVDGQDIKPNKKGLAIYKFKTSKKLGSYSIPVKIRLLDEDSVEQTRTFNVEYNLVDAIKKH